jgi:hypothetical protein
MGHGKHKYRNVASAREKIAEFVKRQSHDAIGGIECLFNTISVMNINIDVEDASMISERQGDGNKNVTDRNTN